METSSPVVLGLVGLGGWAGHICKLLEEQSAAPGLPSAPIHFAAACEPDHVLHAAKIAQLRGRGVKVFQHVDELLAEPIEAVWLPLPIDLHRPFTEKALAAGKAVMCEKPVAGCIDEVDAMIAARDRVGLPVAVGYPDIYDPTTLPLKRRLVEGLIGPIRHASVFACWPRGDQYYGRNGWAGRLKRGATWVLDSPAQNALAHYLNIALYLMGSTLHAAATPVAVEAELYRVNPIENYDTISMRLTLATGATLLVNLTHACERNVNPELVMVGERGVIKRSTERVAIEMAGNVAPMETIARNQPPLPYELRRFAAAVRGLDDPHIGIATLENSRAHTVAINGASQAAPVATLSDSEFRIVDFEGGKLRAIPGIENLFTRCTQTGKMLHESGLAGWTRPSRRLDLHGYRHFAGLPA